MFVFGIKKRVECNYTSRKRMQLIKSENLTFTLLILMTLNFLVKTHKFQGLLTTQTKIKFRIYSNFWFSYYFLRHTLSIYTNYFKVQRCKYICIYIYMYNVHSIKIKVWVHFLAKITLTISWNIIAYLMMFEF